LFNIAGSIRADDDGLAEHRLERRHLTMGGPQLELGVTAHADLQEVVFPTIVQLELGDDLRVAPLEPLSEAKQGGQRPHHLPISSLQITIARV